MRRRDNFKSSFFFSPPRLWLTKRGRKEGGERVCNRPNVVLKCEGEGGVFRPWAEEGDTTPKFTLSTKFPAPGSVCVCVFSSRNFGAFSTLVREGGGRQILVVCVSAESFRVSEVPGSRVCPPESQQRVSRCLSRLFVGLLLLLLLHPICFLACLPSSFR